MTTAKKLAYNRKGRSIHRLLCGVCLTVLSADCRCLNEDSHNSASVAAARRASRIRGAYRGNP